MLKPIGIKAIPVAKMGGGFYGDKEEDILQIEIEDEWSDDHMPCAKVEITKGDELRTFEILWTSPEILSALEYADESPRAFNRIKELIDLVFNFENLEKDEEDDDYICTKFGSLQSVRVLS